MTQNFAILRASRLRAIMAMTGYEETINRWIEEALTQALHDMAVAKEPNEMFAAQGAYKAVESIKDQFAGVFSAEKGALNKIEKTLEKEKTND